MTLIYLKGVRFVAGLCFVAAMSVHAGLGQGSSPRLFAPGVISGPADDLSPAFMPDGKTVFFTRGNSSGSMIMESELVSGVWSTPHIASFSGRWSDLEPTMSPDGSFLVFASNRPSAGGEKAIDGQFNGKVFPQAGGNLWRVDRKDGHWGEPYRLPETINHGTGTFSPSICSDGSIYFMQPDEKTGHFHLYRSQYRSGTYLSAVRIGVGGDETEDVDPAVAPDESFLVYSSNRPAQHEPKRLKIVHRKNGEWGTPVDLGDEVNEKGTNIEARLGPDLRTLYFSTNTVPPASYPRTAEESNRLAAEMEVWANGSENIWYVPLVE